MTNIEETRSPSVEQSRSSEETIPIKYPIVPQSSDQGALMTMEDEDCEHGCNYCKKKFTNKQALGGHQNAHKLERTIEKSAHKAHENGLGYFGGPSGPHFRASYPKAHDLMSKSYLSWPYPSSYNGLSIGYNSRPIIHMPIEPSGPQPVPGFTNAHGAWYDPSQRHSRYPNPYVANHGPIHRFPNFGEGSSNSVRLVSEYHQGLSDFDTTLRLGPSTNLGDANNEIRMNGPIDQEIDESGLDLTLRL